jgi:hypothetical protein
MEFFVRFSANDFICSHSIQKFKIFETSEHEFKMQENEELGRIIWYPQKGQETAKQ